MGFKELCLIFGCASRAGIFDRLAKLVHNKKQRVGKCIVRSMSALELFGPILAISSGYAWAKNQPVVLWVDNAAPVFIYR